MKVLKCPSCKKDAVTPYMGGQFGKYICKNCGYIGALVIEEDIDIPTKIKNKRR